MKSKSKSSVNHRIFQFASPLMTEFVDVVDVYETFRGSDRIYVLFLHTSKGWFWSKDTYTTDRYKAVSTADSLSHTYVPVGVFKTLHICDDFVNHGLPPFARRTHRSNA